MAKKKIYMVLDTETATMPFVNSMMLSGEEKKKVAIARPLVYDIGWVLMYRDGTIIKKESYLVSEIFCVPSIFNTAYYAEKRPLYLDRLNRGETSVKMWDEIMKVFVNDLALADCVGAYNAMFDFKKAIPFTELYIKKLYSPYYQEWENTQKEICNLIAHEPYRKDREKVFDPEHFNFRGENYDLFDIWGESVNTLLDTCTYRNLCLDYGMITASGEYFKTSAESSFRYVCEKYDFDEAHMAIDDTLIESYLLAKILKRKAVKIGITYFPFRNLGTTVEYMRKQHKKGKAKQEHIDKLVEIMSDRCDSYNFGSAYHSRLLKYINELEGMSEM